MFQVAVFCNFKGGAQNLVHDEYVEVLPSGGFIKKVELSCWLLSSAEPIVLPYGELEEVSNLEVFYGKNGGKSKKLKSSEIIDESILGSSYYSGYRAKVVRIPEPSFVKITYSVFCPSLLFLSHVKLDGAAQVSCQIHCPADFKLEVFKDSNLIVRYNSDTISEREGVLYTFHRDNENKKEEDKLAILPIVVYADSFQSGWSYFNDWYTQVADRQFSVLSDGFKDDLKGRFGDVSDQKVLLKLIFRMVQNEIHYLDIENGMGAIEPRSADMILLKKQGDCKDMSNLIFAICKVFDIECHLALSSTIGHPLDMVFPSLVCANHVVAVAVIDGQEIILDATDESCQFGFPSQHIQGRKIFVANEMAEGKVMEVPVVSSVSNRHFTKVILDVVVGKEIHGVFEDSYQGLSGGYVKFFMGQVSRKEFIQKFQQYLRNELNSTKLAVIEYSDGDTLIINGEMELPSKLVTSLGQTHLLSLNFLPYPEGYDYSGEKRLQLYSTEYHSLQYEVRLEHKVVLEKIQPIKIDQGAFQFEAVVEQMTPTSLKIDYTFVCDKIALDSIDLEGYRLVEKEMDRFFNLKIVYHDDLQ